MYPTTFEIETRVHAQQTNARADTDVIVTTVITEHTSAIRGQVTHHSLPGASTQQCASVATLEVTDLMAHGGSWADALCNR